jgi:hypothetical protein
VTDFERWLANSPTGSFIKIALAAALGAIGSYLATAEIHPLVVALSAAVLPVVINYLNPKDYRYGRGVEDHVTFELDGGA